MQCLVTCVDMDCLTYLTLVCAKEVCEYLSSYVMLLMNFWRQDDPVPLM
jgi:hypothetical protein